MTTTLVGPPPLDTDSDSKAAPGTLEQVRAFLNTADLVGRTDIWSTPEAATTWFNDHDFCAAPIEASDLVRLRSFREAVRDFIEYGSELPAESRALLDDEMHRCMLRMTFTGIKGDDIRITPASDDVESIIAWVLVLIREAQLSGTWSRLKICRSRTCRFAFYDHSKNDSSQWCSMKVCGNREKARRYRERKAAS